MGRKNKIYELDEAIIVEFNKLLSAKKLTIEELKDFLNSHQLNKGVEISESGVGRYKKAFDLMMKEFQALDHLVKNLPRDVDFNSEDDLHRLLYKILSKAVLDNSLGKELKPAEIMLLSRSLKDLMSSTKDREKIKADLRKEIKAETILKVESVAIKAGISQESINLIKEALKD